MANGMYDADTGTRCDWATGCPEHPHYSDLPTIASITERISAELMRYALDSVQRLVRDSEDAWRLWAATAPHSAVCWETALRTHRYGAIYWLPRREAERALPLVRVYGAELTAIADLLSADGRANAIFNDAVGRFVQSPERRRIISDEIAPPNGFLSLDPHTVAIRRDDFAVPSTRDLFTCGDALYDLHDLSHFACACLSPDLYGGKHFSGMTELPPPLLAMVLSPEFRRAAALPHTDRLVFSELLNPLFESMDYRDVPEEALVESMAGALFGYLVRECGLLHPTSREIIHAKPVTPEQLAVLAQHKTYELPASEMEQHLFTRGGADHPDGLSDLSPPDRVEYVASLTRARTYHEARNTLKHRAHKEAYRKAVLELMDDTRVSASALQLLRQTHDYLTYADYRRGKRLNLYHVVIAHVDAGSVGQAVAAGYASQR